MIKLPDFIQNNNLHENQRLRYNFAVAVCLSSADSPRKAARIRRWWVRQPGELWPGRFLVNGGTPPPVFPLGVHCCLPGPWDQSLKESWIPYALWRSSSPPRPQSLLCFYSHHCHPKSGSHRSSHLQPSSSFWPTMYITTGLVCVKHSLIPWPPYSEPLMASQAHLQSKPGLLRLWSLVWWLSTRQFATCLQWNRYRNWECSETSTAFQQDSFIWNNFKNCMCFIWSSPPLLFSNKWLMAYQKEKRSVFHSR